MPVNYLAGYAADKTVNQKPASLFIRFPRGFSLPSEIELNAKFARFGPLDISKTMVFRCSGCAQVAFIRSSVAESAFNYVSENDIFGSTTVNFSLRYPSPKTQVDTAQKNECGKHGRHNSMPKDVVKDADGLQENLVQPSDSVALSAEKLSTVLALNIVNIARLLILLSVSRTKICLLLSSTSSLSLLSLYLFHLKLKLTTLKNIPIRTSTLAWM